ncbi:hypothetical protein INT45_010572 [Circinella minor]|uniref:Helitron helicase-like domain-containing protein n=1 Tax=Circinella minor TaxID=1195481 RepID=A0A8H7VFU7_9FUNG|nr:hypothetical protein INT45_010572 [Circinella minor]
MPMIHNGSRTIYHHHFHRLFQQFVANNYARIEFSCGQYITNDQNDLHADLYYGTDDNVDPCQIGRSIILPSSFTGAIIYQRGNSTLFITYTCNPQWPKKQSELLPGQQAFDRSDFCSQVFHMKMTEMLAHIKEFNCFGCVVGYGTTAEFQKWDLPNLPNSATYPQLYCTVTRSMLHGTCGNFNLNAICRKGGQCSQDYSKPFVVETRVSRDSYPIYHRHENIHNHHHFQRSNFIADNSHVIPYNPYLCQKYNIRINVEICTSSRIIKYLFKYLTRGSDRAQIKMVQCRESEAVQSTNATLNTTDVLNDVEPELIDEVIQFQKPCYIGPYKAIWRTFKYQAYVHYLYM